MVELREQLGGLLRLEETYRTRDYLDDLAMQNENGNCQELSDSTTSLDHVETTAVDEEEGMQNDASVPSRAASTSGSSTNTTEQRAVSWREKICEWSYQVADHFDLTRDLVYIALNYVDRVCAASDTVGLLRDKSRFQLLAMAALCLAIKLHGGMDTHAPGVESSIVETILLLGRGHFSAAELKAMETHALQHLQWRLNPPTPQTFVLYLLELFPVEEKTEISDIAQYTIELSVHDYYLIPSKPSVLALAALSNAAHMLGHSEAWMTDITDDLLRHDGYEEGINIDTCKDRLNRLYANTGTKLEDFVDVSALANRNHLDGMSRERSPTSVVT